MAGFRARAVIALSLMNVVTMASSGSAATRSFSIPVTAVSDGTLGFFQDGAVGFPDNASTNAYVSFTLPADYKAGSAIQLRFYLSSSNAPCDVSFGASYLARNRAGVVSAEFSNPSTSAGMPGGSMSAINFTTPTVTVVKAYRIEPATTGSLTTQIPGDGLAVIFHRAGADSGDTCPGYLDLRFIEVRYRTP